MKTSKVINCKAVQSIQDNDQSLIFVFQSGQGHDQFKIQIRKLNDSSYLIIHMVLQIQSKIYAFYLFMPVNTGSLVNTYLKAASRQVAMQGFGF